MPYTNGKQHSTFFFPILLWRAYGIWSGSAGRRGEAEEDGGRREPAIAATMAETTLPTAPRIENTQHAISSFDS
jgi:hypothetical protein